MEAKDFNAWLQAMNYSDAEATRNLGLGSRNTVAKYKIEGAPQYIGLACAALALGKSSWRSDQEWAENNIDAPRRIWIEDYERRLIDAGMVPIKAAESANTD